MQINRVITSLTLAASLFTDPSIVPKYLGFSPAAYVPVVLALVLYQIAFLLLRGRLQVRYKIGYAAIIFLTYAIVSIYYRIWVSQSTGDFSLHVLMVANFYFLLLLRTDDAWQESFLAAIYIAGIAHFASLIPDPIGFRDNLIAATAYDLGEGGLGSLSRRETGLFPAPAMLVAFSLALFAVAFFSFEQSGRKFWPTAFIAIALALGLSTFNRSFFIGIVFTLIILSWCGGVRTKLLVFYAIGGIILSFMPLGEYFDFFSTRTNALLDGGIEASQRWTGDTGISTGFDIFLNHPLFGNPIAPNGGTLQALGSMSQIVNPHNGLVQILAIYGLIAGAPILLLYAWAIVVITRLLANRRTNWAELKNSQNLTQSKLFFAAISATFFPILMIEPVGEYSFIFLLFISPIFTSIPHNISPRVNGQKIN